MSIPSVDRQEIELIRRDKYAGKTGVEIEVALQADAKRLACGEPLAYVIGWIPFLDTKIYLDSKPLIPRPETEQWAEELIAHLHEKFRGTPGESGKPFTLLDLCAGSGAIGIAVLKALPNVHVCFAELDASHLPTIQKSLAANSIDLARVELVAGDLFENLYGRTFDIIATNPPYIPQARELSESVATFEPHAALYSGTDGLDLIRRITQEAREHLNPSGEMWIECDVENIREAAECLRGAGAQASIHTDHYGRERYIVGQFT